jgi:hypothetical protein
MFSSPRDMAVFLAANLGELPTPPTLHEAMALAQRSVLNISERNQQALAWEITTGSEPAIIEHHHTASAIPSSLQLDAVLIAVGMFFLLVSHQ